jgi:phosphoglycerol transferase MdoB-like AlkP superfamily enzyme
MAHSVVLRRSRLHLPLRLPPDLLFWIALLILNGLLFLPAYLFNQESSRLQDLAVVRPNFDLFRLNLELFVFVTLWIFVKPLQRGWVRWLFTTIYLLAFGYYVYEGISLFIYFSEPVFYSQSHLITAGLPFLLQGLNLSVVTYVAAGASFVTFVGLIHLLAHTMTEETRVAQLSRFTQATMISICGLMLVLLIYSAGKLSSPEMVVSSLFTKLEQNLAESIHVYQKIHDYEDSVIFETYDYTDKELETKPNVYLIFIESYGSVLYKRKDWIKPYRALLADVEADLSADGWSMASALSEAPIWGGGSWMSYTSALFGLRIDNDAEYLALLDTYQYKEYPDFGAYLRSQGYHYAWLTPISRELKEEKWQEYMRFYGMDQWVRFRDLDYVGPMVSWGPAPLDQYSLNFARELVEETSDKPILFYNLTQNSHYPWYELPEIVDDWRTLNDPDYPQPNAPAELIKHDAKRQNYFNSIRYELKMLSDFIRSDAAENSIFVLVGDHQPPQVSRRDDGSDTPIHIISRDANFVESFFEYGFDPGMDVSVVEPVLRHEGIYSLLVRQLLQQYGKEGVDLPNYLPNGVSFSVAETEP